jgi:2-dehydropantoate 2-reductase
VRYIIYGAGAVGATIGARLFEAGNDVVLIARGEHGRALAERGLRFGTPEGWQTLPIPVVEHPNRLTIGADDVVVLAMKSQDTASASAALALIADPETAIVCAQNGVANERRVLRYFANVHGMCVLMPAVHLEPGVVHVHSAPYSGTCDLGRFPRGCDALDTTIAEQLSAASIHSTAYEDIMPRKYAKLLTNLGNVIEAASGRQAAGVALLERARREAEAVFATAGIVAQRGAEGDMRLSLADVPGVERPGGSTYQSLARGTPSLETDDLNGEIVLLGRLYGVATPVNAMLQRLARRLVAERIPAGSVPLAELERALA